MRRRKKLPELRTPEAQYLDAVIRGRTDYQIKAVAAAREDTAMLDFMREDSTLKALRDSATALG